MLEDIIFSKLYKNKRYYKKIFEEKSYNQSKDIKTRYNKIKSVLNFLVKNFSASSNDSIFWNYESSTNILFVSSGINNIQSDLFPVYDMKNNFIDTVKSIVSMNVSKSKITFDNNQIEVYPFDNYTDINNIAISYVMYIEINIATLEFRTHIASYTYSALHNYGKTIMDEVASKFNLRTIKYNNFIQLFNAQIIDTFPQLQNNKKFDDQLSDKEIENILKNISYDQLPRLLKDYSKEEMNITSKSNTLKDNTIILFQNSKNLQNNKPVFLTDDIVSDEQARKPSAVCDMVKNNVKSVLSRLKSENPVDAFRVSVSKLIPQEIAKEKLISYYDEYIKNSQYADKIDSNQWFDAHDTVDNSIKICNAYINEMDLIKNGDFNTDIPNSAGLNYSLQVYLPEITCPLAICKNNCVWNEGSKNEGIQGLLHITGLNSEEELWSNSYIVFPKLANNKLFDATIYINNKKLDVSVKAGATGQGAKASFSSLADYIYLDDSYTKLNLFGKLIQKEMPIEFEIYEIISGVNTKYKNKDEVINDINAVLSKYKLENIESNTFKDLFESDSAVNMSDLVLRILQSAKYDFIQMNALPSADLKENKDFHFKYFAQYPAVFQGKVLAELSSNGKVNFHLHNHIIK